MARKKGADPACDGAPFLHKDGKTFACECGARGKDGHPARPDPDTA